MSQAPGESGLGSYGGEHLLETRNLKMHFPVKAGVFRRTVGHLKAVDGVDLQVRRGETLGIVGESGCGKSTLAKLILRLLTPSEGEVLFEGESLLSRSRSQMLAARRDMQIVFQDPYASLNPRMTVGNIVAEPLDTHAAAAGSEQEGIGSKKKARKKRVQELLELVGLSPEHYNRYPHEFSGGQRQRVGIARAIALNPKLIICDEPVSALDVSIQAQIINLLEALQQELNLTYIFIAHDLAVVEHACDRVAVMYLGKIVEMASKKDLYKRPRHPYTNALLSAIPTPDPIKERQRRRVVLGGDVPSPANPPSGCHFHPRCPRATEYCKHHVPALDLQDKSASPASEASSEPTDPAAPAATSSTSPASAERWQEALHEHRAACFFPVLEGERIEGASNTQPYRADESGGQDRQDDR